jgi:hypothetical protein
MGKSYNPTAWLGSQNTLVLMRHIWQSRQQSMHAVLASMKQLSQYKELKQNDFSALATGMVDRELINMIIDAKAFNDPQYVVFNVAAPGAEPKMRVGYKRLDGMTTTLHYGASLPAKNRKLDIDMCITATGSASFMQDIKLLLLGFAKLKRELCPLKKLRDICNSRYHAVAFLMLAFPKPISTVFWELQEPCLVSPQTSAISLK